MLDHDAARAWLAESPSATGDPRPPRVLGFGTAWQRESTWYLALLFIRPEAQAEGLGRRLLLRTFPDGPTGVPPSGVPPGSSPGSTVRGSTVRGSTVRGAAVRAATRSSRRPDGHLRGLDPAHLDGPVRGLRDRPARAPVHGDRLSPAAFPAQAAARRGGHGVRRGGGGREARRHRGRGGPGTARLRPAGGPPAVGKGGTARRAVPCAAATGRRSATATPRHPAGSARSRSSTTRSTRPSSGRSWDACVPPARTSSSCPASNHRAVVALLRAGLPVRGVPRHPLLDAAVHGPRAIPPGAASGYPSPAPGEHGSRRTIGPLPGPPGSDDRNEELVRTRPASRRAPRAVRPCFVRRRGLRPRWSAGLRLDRMPNCAAGSTWRSPAATPRTRSPCATSAATSRSIASPTGPS